jgi:branched-chain amino acid transport system substrate-binding protein
MKYEIGAKEEDVDDRFNGPTTRRRWVWPLLLALVTLALAVGAASCGGDEEAAAPPPAEPAPAEPAPAEPPAESVPAETGETTETAAPPAEAADCPADDGVINVFSASDLESATIGQNISPGAFVRMTNLFLEKVNAEGGILGCQVEFTGAEDGFVIDECLRLYREALQSNQYDVYFGPTNSGCMAGLPDLIGAAGKFLISGIAADHQPFFSDCSQTACFKEPYYVAHASVSTFLEGRASAKFAADNGWKAPALMVPNYAYGQDVGKGFKSYYNQLVPDGQVVNEQFPEFDEDNFTPFINAMVGANPDGILTAFFSSFMLPFISQWQGSGNDADIDIIAGLASLDSFAGLKSEADIPQNAYGYDRGNWRLLENNPVAKEYIDLWTEAYGDEFPIPDSFTFQLLSTWQMAKALIEKTQTVDAETWKQTIEAGDFSFDGPYNPGPTYVNPVSHMGDTCASVGTIVWDTSVPIPASYDPDSFVLGCMHEVFTPEEVRELTTNPDVTDEALATYYELATGGG